MANRKSKSQGNETAADNADGRKKKSRLDYTFEGMTPEGNWEDMNLVIHNPTDARLVETWLKQNHQEYTDYRDIRVVKKTII